VGEFSVLGLIAVGTGLWLFQQQASQNAQLQPDSSPRSDNGGKSDHTGVVSQLEAEAENHVEQRAASVGSIRAAVGTAASAELDRQEIHLAVTGGKAVGKTTLIRVLESNWKPQQQLCWKETPALFIGTDAVIQKQLQWRRRSDQTWCC